MLAKLQSTPKGLAFKPAFSSFPSLPSVQTPSIRVNSRDSRAFFLKAGYARNPEVRGQMSEVDSAEKPLVFETARGQMPHHLS